MAAGVVERLGFRRRLPGYDERIRVDVEHEVVAGALHLTRVAGEEPTSAPDALEVELVDAEVGLELAGERVPGLCLASRRSSWAWASASGVDGKRLGAITRDRV
jgi:hypothetical protein